MKGRLFEGELKSFPVVTHTPSETFLLMNCLFDATNASSRFLRNRQIFVN